MNEIKDALGRVADASAPTPLSLEHVRGRARQIRRRRTTTAVIGSAAAVAAIAGLGVALMPSTGRDGSLPPATRTPSVTPSVTEAPGADEVGPVHRVRTDVPVEQTFNDEPRVPYWLDGQIIDTDGSATPFPDRPFTFAKDPQTHDWVVIQVGEAHAELVRITDDGRQVGAAVPSFENGLAVGPGGELVTITQDGSRSILTAGDRVMDLGPGLEYTEIHGVTSNGDVLFQGADGSVDIARPDAQLIEPATPPASAAVTSPQRQFVAYADDSTWRMQDESGTPLWSVDWAGVSSFSLDGAYVALTGDPKHRVPGSAEWDSPHATSTIWIRTSGSLLPTAAFVAPENGYFWSWVWDGDDLLANLYQRDTGEWSQVRLAADGFTVGRGRTRPGGGEEPPYVFAAQ
jgi:hypothetical protein